MDGGFPYGDIIVIGALAAFIILRYRAMLGTKTERDETITPRSLSEFERVIQLPDRDKQAAAKSKATEKDYGALAENFVAMRALDKQFSPDDFLEGARAAFEMVVEAYNTADRETLQSLLSKEIYAEFDTSLTEQQAQGRLQKTTLVAIVESTITAAVLSGSLATLTVKFVSEQIILVRNTQGEVVEGDASHQEAVEDLWVFTRTLTSADPAWKVIDT